MNKKVINIGTDAIGREVELDLETLLVTRALVQGASGAGKSRFLRRMAEQAFGKVPIIILDPEGEFASLREKFDFVLAGRGGETPADPRSAALLATKLLELRASAVCDLYNLKPLERHTFVRLFIESLMNADKRLWHPCLVMVDEAHRYAPEKGAGESEASEAMTSLATDGRKRGLAAIFATQRLGKLRKDAAAELLNVFIGQTFMDIDRQRAADALGVPKGQEQRDFFARLKVLNRGSFYGLGQAVSLDAVLIKAGEVQTTHPKVGAKTSNSVPPAPEAIKALLPQLADLPKQAEDKARTETDLRKEIMELRKQLKAVPLGTPVETKKEKAELVAQLAAEFERGRKSMADASKKQLDSMLGELSLANAKANVAVSALGERITFLRGSAINLPAAKASTSIPSLRAVKIASTDPEEGKSDPKKSEANGTLTNPEQRIIDAIAWMNSIGVDEPEQPAVAFLAGYTYNCGGYNNPRGHLNQLGLVQYIPDGKIKLTSEGQERARQPQKALDTEELQRLVLARLPNPEQRILSVLIESYPEFITHDECATRARYTPNTGGYNNPRGRLRSLGLVEYGSGGTIKAKPLLFLE